MSEKDEQAQEQENLEGAEELTEETPEVEGHAHLGPERFGSPDAHLGAEGFVGPDAHLGSERPA